MLVRGTGDKAVLGRAIQREIQTVDPNLPVANISEMKEIMNMGVGDRRFAAWLLAIFSAIALILTSVGMHGVTSYAIALRTKELGIRSALEHCPAISCQNGDEEQHVSDSCWTDRWRDRSHSRGPSDERTALLRDFDGSVHPRRCRRDCNDRGDCSQSTAGAAGGAHRSDCGSACGVTDRDPLWSRRILVLQIEILEDMDPHPAWFILRVRRIEACQET